MAAADSVGILEGLPAAGVLLEPKDDRASVFSELKSWVKAHSTSKDLQEAGRLVNEGYRCAVVLFITRESQRGVRSRQAQDLLKILSEVSEWAPQTQLSLPELEAKAAQAAQQPAPAVSSAALSAAHSAMKKSLAGLPTPDKLEDAGKLKEAFSELYSWVKDRTKKAPNLAEAGMMLDVDHRRAIFAFLCDFVKRKNALRSRCREVLWLLARTEEWCEGDAADQTALAEALGDYKDMHVRTMGGEKGVEKQRTDEVLHPILASAERRMTATVSEPPGGASTSARAARAPVGRTSTGPAVGAQVSITKVDHGSLPSRDVLEDPELRRPSTASGADPRKVFKDLKEAVRERYQTHQLDQLALQLDLEHRRSIFAFLFFFVEKNAVLREQTRALLRQLSESEAWTRGGAADLEAVERALTPAAAKDDAAVARTTSGRAADSSLSPRFAERPSLREPDQPPVELPAAAELRNPEVDLGELFQRVVVWTMLFNEQGNLGEEGARLTAEHRAAVIGFMCTFATPKKGGKAAFRKLAQKVLSETEKCEEWRAGREASLTAAVKKALNE